jgi:hypothetical protein
MAVQDVARIDTARHKQWPVREKCWPPEDVAYASLFRPNGTGFQPLGVIGLDVVREKT